MWSCTCTVYLLDLSDYKLTLATNLTPKPTQKLLISTFGVKLINAKGELNDGDNGEICREGDILEKRCMEEQIKRNGASSLWAFEASFLIKCS